MSPEHSTGLLETIQIDPGKIRTRTKTTKANVATALQMVSWGVEVNDYGNA